MELSLNADGGSPEPFTAVEDRCPRTRAEAPTSCQVLLRDSMRRYVGNSGSEAWSAGFLVHKEAPELELWRT